jgi:pimeloyl-ACP methyl ester carboxylesterase
LGKEKLMPVLERNGLVLHYEEFGSGYPLLLFAPGGMRSSIDFWSESGGTKRAWIDPTIDLSDRFRVIAMDQRNAGSSRGPIRATDGWATYTRDHVALLDHIGIDRCHVMGGCIGSSYCLGLIEAAPERVTAAVLQNPIGLSEANRDAFYAMFDDWASELEAGARDVDETALAAMRQNLFGGDFVFAVPRDFVKSCPVPLLVLAGNDQFHPTLVAEEIARLAPIAELVRQWAGDERKPATRDRIRRFLEQHTPANDTR